METETSTEHIKRYSQVDLNRNARFDWRTFNSNLLPQHSLTDKFTAKKMKKLYPVMKVRSQFLEGRVPQVVAPMELSSDRV